METKGSKTSPLRIAVIGAGAAGYFAAIQAKINHSNAQVTIFEKSNKTLAKVKISGGGRCNVTNSCRSISELSKNYPRGTKQLKKALRIFSTTDTIAWFEKHGVKLYAQEDQRMFPITDDSQTIVDCLEQTADALNIKLVKQQGIKTIITSKTDLELISIKDDTIGLYDKVIVACGGSPKKSGLQWIEDLGHKIIDPVPSLFTFNIPKEPIRELMGLSIQNVKCRIVGTKLETEGPLLITHWGLSGPAILKLSAFGARHLHGLNYQFTLLVSWLGDYNFSNVSEFLQEFSKQNPQKKIENHKPEEIPSRLWSHFLDKAQIPRDKKWVDLGKKDINRFTSILCNDEYQVHGKTTFKEEFVTCGGVSLESIDFTKMQSKVDPRIYFAGEVIDVDGVTGGFNFQAAWTTGFIAGKLSD